MKANTQQELTTTILPKLIWDAVWELDENLFSCWANTSSSLKKNLFTKRIELMYGFGGEFLLMVLVVVWGIFQKYGFSGEQNHWTKCKLLGHWQTRFFLLRNFNISPGSYLLRASYVIHFYQYLRTWSFFAGKKHLPLTPRTTLGWNAIFRLASDAVSIVSPQMYNGGGRGGSFVEFLTWEKWV